jgi:phage portal protein BeeE
VDRIREPFAGAWQRNIDLRPQNVLTHSALYACVTLIASDIGKLRIKLVQQDDDGIWSETESAAFSPVLRKPNHYQNRIKFVEQWILSKLIHGKPTS